MTTERNISSYDAKEHEVQDAMPNTGVRRMMLKGVKTGSRVLVFSEVAAQRR